MNECFTDPIFRNFSVERKREVRQAVQGEEVEGEVSYSVGGDLQITLK